MQRPDRRLLRWLALLPALVLPLLLGTCQAEQAQDPAYLATVRQGSFAEQVKLVGDIEARAQRYLAPAFSAKLQMLAEDGAPVKKGQVVARLDISELEERLDDEKLELDSARNDLVEHDRNTEAEKVRLNAEIQRAQAELAQKDLALRERLAGTRKEELEKVRLQQELAFQALDLSRSNLALKEKLAAKGMSTQLEILQARLELSQRERDFKVAEAESQVARAGATPLARELARKEQQMARKALDWARQKQSLTLKKAALERQKKQVRQNSLAARVKTLETQIKQAELKAPMAGTVVLSRVWTQEGLKRVSVGDDVYEGNAFVSVADLTSVSIRAEMDETLLREIQPGQRCSISLPSLKGQTFEGEIQRIGVLAHTRSGRLNTQGLSKVFDLTILPTAAAQQTGVFQPGTSVDITLPFKQQRDVLLLPRQAIQREGSRYFVLRPDGQPQDVEIGDANATEVWVRSGLQPGDQVLLSEPLAQPPTAASSSPGAATASASPAAESAAPAAASAAPPVKEKSR